MRRALIAGVLSLVWVCFGAGPVRAADDKLASPESLAPKGTVVYLQLAPLTKLRQQIDDFGNAAIGMPYMMASEPINVFFDSAEAKAVDPERPIGVCLLAPAVKGGEPRVFVLVPEAVPGAFKQAVERERKREKGGEGEPFLELPDCQVQSMKGYAVVGEPGSLASFAPAGASSSSWKPTLAAATAALVADLAALQAAFSDQIGEGIGQMKSAMHAAPAQTGPDPARILEVELDCLRKVANMSSKLELALDLSDKGLVLRTLLAPRSGTALEKFLAAQKGVVAKPALGALSPASAWCVMDCSWDLTLCGRQYASLMEGIMGACGVPVDAAARAGFAAWASGPQRFAYTAASTPSAAMQLSGLVSCATAEQAKCLAASLETWTKVKSPCCSWRPCQAKDPAVRAYEAVYTAAPDASPQEQMAAKTLEIMYGNPAIWGVSQAGPHIAVALGKDGADRVKGILAGAQGRESAAATLPGWYAKLSETFPAGSQAHLGVSVLGMARLAGKAMEAQMGANPLAMLDKMALTDAGIGWYGLFSQKGCETGLVIPTETFVLIQQVAMPLAMAGAAGGGVRRMPPDVEELR